MRIGIGLWCLQSTATRPVPFARVYRELCEDAKLVEQLKLDSLWLSEHHVYYDGYCPALLPAASAALSVTRTLRVGTGVLLLPLQQPQRVLRAAAELHQRFHGRFELGMGMGYRPIEFSTKGLDIRDRLARMNTALDALATAPRQEMPPLWVGVTSVAAARRAGRRGLGLMISGAFSKAVVDELCEAHRTAWLNAGSPGGLKPPVGLLRNIWITEKPSDREQALAWVRSSYLVYAGLGWGADDTGVDFRQSIKDSMASVSDSALVGSSDEIIDGLRQYNDVELVIARIGYDAPPREEIQRLIARLGSDVAPKLAGIV